MSLHHYPPFTFYKIQFIIRFENVDVSAVETPQKTKKERK